MSTLTKVAEFTGTRDFEAAALADAWCRERNISVGPPQRGAARGLVRGDAMISKWRNMTNAEHNSLDGRMTGDMRTGPVEVWMREESTPSPKREPGYVASIHGRDGKCLGMSFDVDSCIRRDEYDAWEEFLQDFSRIAMTRIPRDETSFHARAMISDDDERLNVLRNQRDAK